MIRQQQTTRRWIGLSSDIKPVPGAADVNGSVYAAEDVTVGSTFFETDTNRTTTWNGGAWVGGPSPSDDLLLQLKAQFDELLRIRRVLEEANALDSDQLV